MARMKTNPVMDRRFKRARELLGYTQERLIEMPTFREHVKTWSVATIRRYEAGEIPRNKISAIAKCFGVPESAFISDRKISDKHFDHLILSANSDVNPVDADLGEATIFLSVSEDFFECGVKFGLLHVRDGKDQVSDHGPLLNREIYFEHADRRKTLSVVVRHAKNIGFQFKCFADHPDLSFQSIKNMLENHGYKQVSKGGGKSFRAWFILDEHEECKTVDGITNNFYYPS